MRIAIVGDIHGRWEEADRKALDRLGLDFVLFVGDLPGRLGRATAVARRIAELATPAAFVPGNHDGLSLLSFAGELLGSRALVRLGAFGHARRVRRIESALGPVRLLAYDWLELEPGPDGLSLVAARPHAMGGGLTARPYLRAAHGIADLEASARRLAEVVDRIPHRRLLFLAHNGPAGLGGEPADPWGCDFRPGGGDWGDPDLRAGIDHARARGRTVLAVVAGHMHHPTRTRGRPRRWVVEEGGTWYVNAARVPRIAIREGRRARHHVELRIDGDHVQVEEVWTDGAGTEQRYPPPAG